MVVYIFNIYVGIGRYINKYIDRYKKREIYLFIVLWYMWAHLMSTGNLTTHQLQHEKVAFW